MHIFLCQNAKKNITNKYKSARIPVSTLKTCLPIEFLATKSADFQSMEEALDLVEVLDDGTKIGGQGKE